MKWERLDEKSLKDIHGSHSHAKLTRAYRLRGQTWPILVVSIYSSALGFKVSCNEKEGPSEWWGEIPIPSELRADLIEMIKEVEL